MEDKTFPMRREYRPPIVDLDQIEDPVARREWEEIEKTQREIERINRQVETELRQQGLI